jgi:hypothetical protein
MDTQNFLVMSLTCSDIWLFCSQTSTPEPQWFLLCHGITSSEIPLAFDMIGEQLFCRLQTCSGKGGEGQLVWDCCCCIAARASCCHHGSLSSTFKETPGMNSQRNNRQRAHYTDSLNENPKLCAVRNLWNRAPRCFPASTISMWFSEVQISGSDARTTKKATEGERTMTKLDTSTTFLFPAVWFHFLLLPLLILLGQSSNIVRGQSC